MREYKIARCDLWFNIYRKREQNWLISLWFLWPNDKRVLRKEFAKVYYHKEDALSALVIVKRKDEKDAD